MPFVLKALKLSRNEGTTQETVNILDAIQFFRWMTLHHDEQYYNSTPSVFSKYLTLLNIA